VRTGWISSAGEFITRFEQDWAAYCGREHGVAVSSGTASLQAAVAALGIGPGDEIILPAFTIISCASAVVASGATPVLVDADPRTWSMRPEDVATRITPRTRGIMAVHIYGHPVDMDALTAVADERGLWVLEDAAEAHGAEVLCDRDDPEPRWRRCGGFGALSCFSFYANKLVTTGEGGMVLTDDPDLAERVRSARNLGFGAGLDRFRHEVDGWNFRMTNLQAALGVAQVERIDAIVERKRWMGRAYTERLEDVAGLQLPVEEPWARNVYWMYGVVLDDSVGFDARECASRLRQRGIGTRPFFLGMHEQPVLRARGLFEGESYPVTERLARRGLYLPSGLALTESQLDEVCDAVREVLA
jgi:perosamine synthetase